MATCSARSRGQELLLTVVDSWLISCDKHPPFNWLARAMSAAAANAAKRNKGTQNSKRAKGRGINRINFRTSLHLKQHLGEEFELPEKMDSVAFLLEAFKVKDGLEEKEQIQKRYCCLKNDIVKRSLNASESSESKAKAKLSAELKRVKAKIMFKADKRRIRQVDQESGTWTMQEKSNTTKRVLVLTKSRLYLLMRKDHGNQNSITERNSIDHPSEWEIVDSIPLHEIDCFEILTKADEESSEYTLKALNIDSVCTDNKSDRSPSESDQYLFISTEKSGFNGGAMFCFTNIEIMQYVGKDTKKAGNDLRVIKAKLEKYRKAALVLFQTKTFIRQKQVCYAQAEKTTSIEFSAK